MSQSATAYQIRKQMFEALYEDYQEPIKRHIERHLVKWGVHDQDIADDRCQETFEQLWELLRKQTVVKQYAYYRNWLYKTAKYRAIDYLRRKKPIGYLSMLENEDLPELTVEGHENRICDSDRLRQVLAQMKPMHQQVVWLIDQGLKQKDIAEELGISESAVSEILHDVKFQLQRKYFQVTVVVVHADTYESIIDTFNFIQGMKAIVREEPKEVKELLRWCARKQINYDETSGLLTVHGLKVITSTK